jgi:hypothetical protein
MLGIHGAPAQIQAVLDTRVTSEEYKSLFSGTSVECGG